MKKIQGSSNFYVLLTGHPSITLDNDQLSTHFFILQYVYFNPLHVTLAAYSILYLFYLLNLLEYIAALISNFLYFLLFGVLWR